MSKEVEIQRQYYAQTANSYDQMHLAKDQEHILALHLLASYIEFYQIRSVLDVGAGTGRAVLWLKNRFPDLVVKGIEPVTALREQGYTKGIPLEDLIDADAYQIPFPDQSFDLVCEFAVLHHVKEPEKVVREMSRVADKMVCISDCNFMGQGSLPLRLLKYMLFSLSLWPVADWIKTKGKGYTISEGDGLAYSYSVYQSLRTLHKFWKNLRVTSTGGTSDTLFGPIISAGQLLLIGLNKK